VRPVLFAVLMMALGCVLPGYAAARTTPSPTSTPPPSDTAISPTDTLLPPTATPEPTLPLPTPDLATRPQIWFSPLDPAPPNASRPFNGREFFDLFADDAAWTNAAERTHVFKLYGGWVAWAVHLRSKKVVDYANRHGMALAFEAGPLTPTDECTGEIEGFAGPREAIQIVQKIKAAGGEIALWTWNILTTRRLCGCPDRAK
jgi:hypothetical protein